MDKIQKFILEKNWHTAMVYDLKKLEQLYKRWLDLLPKIRPHYAVKCNSNLEVLRTLATLGANFDCASKHEIEKVLSITKDPNKIVFSNPCKYVEHIRYAKKNNVNLTVVDSIEELEKIYENSKNTKILLRIYANDKTARYKLSKKYGATKVEWRKILSRAKELKMNIIGVSFHIGSGAKDSNAYIRALEDTKECQEMAKNYGFHIQIIDIGGGFSESNMEEFSKTINFGIKKYFSNEDIHFIAEPGRFLAETTVTLYSKVFGKKKKKNKIYYYISDGIYGCFNCELHGDICPRPSFLTKNILKQDRINSTIFGPTCDSEDVVLKNYYMPEIFLDDYIIWENMGAYTIVASSDFNGINQTKPMSIYKNGENFFYHISSI